IDCLVESDSRRRLRHRRDRIHNSNRAHELRFATLRSSMNSSICRTYLGTKIMRLGHAQAPPCQTSRRADLVSRRRADAESELPLIAGDKKFLWRNRFSNPEVRAAHGGRDRMNGRLGSYADQADAIGSAGHLVDGNLAVRRSIQAA